jgi:predicted house-cleaning NTP pyrophosphatase (Maf/HAM1 superfamily)
VTRPGAALVLASGSAGRLRVLRDAGIEPEVVAFVEGIDGHPSTVIGLSLPVLRQMLAGLGLAITDLWRSCPDAAPAERS